MGTNNNTIKIHFETKAQAQSAQELFDATEARIRNLRDLKDQANADITSITEAMNPSGVNQQLLFQVVALEERYNRAVRVCQRDGFNQIEDVVKLAAAGDPTPLWAAFADQHDRENNS